jgi:hypothetical protein
LQIKPKEVEDVERRKGIKEEEAGNEDSNTYSVKSGSRTEYQICIPLGWAPCWAPCSGYHIAV